MSVLLLSLVTIAYAGIVISEAVKSNHAMACVFAGYTFANLGLMAQL